MGINLRTLTEISRIKWIILKQTVYGLKAGIIIIIMLNYNANFIF